MAGTVVRAATEAAGTEAGAVVEEVAAEAAVEEGRAEPGMAAVEAVGWETEAVRAREATEKGGTVDAVEASPPRPATQRWCPPPLAFGPQGRWVS